MGGLIMEDIIRHSGYLCVNRNNTDHEGTQIQHANTQRYAYDFIDGELVIHAYESMLPLNGFISNKVCFFLRFIT